MKKFVVEQQVTVGKEQVKYVVNGSNSVTSYWQGGRIDNFRFQVGNTDGTFSNVCFHFELNALQI